MNIQWVGSPNYTAGRTKPITTIVIHWIVGTLSTADGVFVNPGSQLSAHYGIENDTIHQYVKDENTAYHAITANPYSIGIEHSAAPGRPASQATINTSAELVRMLCKKHGIPVDRAHIIKHSEVVATQCPGTIPIDEIIKKAKEKKMIPDQDNWFNRFNKLMVQIRGRQITRAEFRKNFVGVDPFRMVEVLSDNAEADKATKAQSVGQVATKDKWDQQIYGLQATVKKLESGQQVTQAEIDDMAKDLDKLKDKLIKSNK